MITAHALAKHLLEAPDFEVKIYHHTEDRGNIVYDVNPDAPGVSASGLVWISVEPAPGNPFWTAEKPECVHQPPPGFFRK
jgi:hypothetical protein